jgi:hypothetical protein
MLMVALEPTEESLIQLFQRLFLGPAKKLLSHGSEPPFYLSSSFRLIRGGVNQGNP